MTHLSGWYCPSCGAQESNPDVQPVDCEVCGDGFCGACLDGEHQCDARANAVPPIAPSRATQEALRALKARIREPLGVAEVGPVKGAMERWRGRMARWRDRMEGGKL